MGFPFFPMVIVIAVGAACIAYAQEFSTAGRGAEALTLIIGGGILAVGAVLWWSVSVDINLLRYELNEMKKEP